MTKTQKMATAIGVSLMTATSAMSASNPQVPLQDSQQAVEFFKSELNFKTNPHGINALISKKTKGITIVDVRTAADFAKGHIPGAINVPFDQHNGFEGTETIFPELRKDGFNYIYCYKLLCNLGQKAAVKFASLGYPVKEMVGGFNEWEKEGNPIEK
jgi:rhodanese-related sulfurtransferase